MNGRVRSIARLPDDTFYAGGDFRRPCDNAACSATTTGFNRVARWDGAAWLPLGNGLNEAVYTVAVSNTGALYAGGTFTGTCNSASCATSSVGLNRIGQWNGSAWLGLGTGTNGIVNALAVAGNGDLYAGGGFAATGCRVSNYFARYVNHLFTASVDDDWSIGGNWNNGFIPPADAGATVKAAVAIASADVTIRDLRVDEGSVLTLQAGRTLTITRSLDILGTIGGPGNVVITNCEPNAVYRLASAGYLKTQLTRCVSGSGAFDFPVGTDSGYSPVQLSNAVGTGDFSVKANPGQYPDGATGLPVNRLNRWWALENSGLVQTDVAFQYPASDVSGTESSYKAFRITGASAFQQPTGIDTALHRATLTAVTEFSDWTLGEQVITAANVTIEGTVTVGRNPVSGALLSLTDESGNIRYARTSQFGNYRFPDVPAGGTYIVSVAHRRFQFALPSRAVFAAADLTGIDFEALSGG
ncbi:MAG: carboxypeptidase regulatory-like domain-containing protein [Acidobacteria bacterium]|nr:carboxypeptidase regulatory-like domain-containing protein [Acidobacteriota bacterium]